MYFGENLGERKLTASVNATPPPSKAIIENLRYYRNKYRRGRVYCSICGEYKEERKEKGMIK